MITHYQTLLYLIYQLIEPKVDEGISGYREATVRSAEQLAGRFVLGKRKRSPWGLVSLGAIVVVLGGIAFWIIEARTAANPKIASQQKVMDRVDYSGLTIGMTDIVAKVENGKISVPLNVVKEKKMVQTVKDSYELAMQNLKIDVPTWKVYEPVEALMNKNGFEFKHGLGHGLGLELHDVPSISHKPKGKERNSRYWKETRRISSKGFQYSER
jgi:phage tail protein X